MTNNNGTESKEETPVNESVLQTTEKKNSEEEKKIEFNKLTPIDYSAMHIYKEGLDFVFENKDIRNIAITGPYGAGKTSLINSYKKLNPKKVFKHISLAHFQPEKEFEETSVEKTLVEEGRAEKEKPGNKNSKHFLEENLLEAKILNQLLHQVDSKNIPKTNFKIKEKIPYTKILINILLLLTLGICCLFLIFYDSWAAYIPNLSEGSIRDGLEKTTNPEFRLIVGAVCISIIAKYLFDLLVIQNNRNIFKKLNLQGNQIEILEESEDSYFDKYLNEVLYVFENSGADAIIFEDIDRYSANQIFGKLREINTLVNNKRDKENEPLRFIFSLRDDVFVSKDRTKFFDFILPVVPVLDGSNSYEQFLQEFKNEVQEETLDTKFLQGISLYVDDMRILKNIYNEFIVYKKRLDTIELDLNKLLALVTYKNIFPRDFSELQLNAGFVYNLFNEKPNFLNDEIATIDRNISIKQDLLSKIHNENLNSIEELDAIYFHSPHILKVVNGHSVENYEGRVDLIKAIRKNPATTTIVDNRYANNIRQVNMDPFLSAMETNPEYIERKKFIQDKTLLEDERLSLEIQQLKKEKQLLNKNKLQNIINKSNIDSIFKSKHTNELGFNNFFEEIRSSPYFPLIKYLVRNGYIDETYPDYMTYFYATSLSIEDKIFLRSISDEEAKEPSYHLKNPELIVSRLDATDFQRSEILNYELLNHLLITSDLNLIYLETLIKQLEDSKNFTFIEGFWRTEKNTKNLVSILNSIWPQFFAEAISISNYSEPLKKKISLDLLSYSSIDELNYINKDNQLATYISDSKDFLDLENPDTKVISDKLDSLNVSFKDLDFEKSHKYLLKEVYDKKLFELNFPLISKFLKQMYLVESVPDLQHKNYSLIMSKKEESLFDYVLDNIQKYLETILDNCGGKITDEPKAILELINNVDIEHETKIQYLELLENSIENIKDVEDVELWQTLLNNSLVAFDVSNVYSYFFCSGKGFDIYLIDFINDFEDEISLDPDFIKSNFEDEGAAQSLYVDIINANSLDNTKYESLLSPFNWYYDKFPFENVDSEKIAILIDLKVIRMTMENLELVRKEYTELLEQFITGYIGEYLHLLKPEVFDLDEALLLLKSSIETSDKLEVLSYNDSVISLRNENFEDEIKKYIIENHFDLADLQFLLANYSDEKSPIQEVIIELISEQFSYVLREKLSIPFNVLREIYLNKKLSEQQNKQLLVLNLNDFDPNEAHALLTILDFKEYLSLFERRNPKILATTEDKQLLEILKQKRWISRYKLEESDSSSYRVYSKKEIRGYSN